MGNFNWKIFIFIKFGKISRVNFVPNSGEVGCSLQVRGLKGEADGEGWPMGRACS